MIPGWKKHSLIEWGAIVALLAVCVVLTALQSRWTGNLGRVATRQQNTQLRSQARSLCHAFDAQLGEACGLLRPRAAQIETLGREEAHAQSLRRWQAGNPRPMFRRLAVVVPEGDVAQLYLLDQKTARLVRMAWPAEWAALEDNMTRHVAGGPPDFFEDPAGLVREYPVFGSRDADRPGESEWIILELDPAYVRGTWLPELAQTYLNPGKETFNEIVVKTRAAKPETVFATNGGEVAFDSDPVVVGFNGKTRPGGGPANTDVAGDAYWTLYAWPRSGELAAAVSNARTHDFTLACVLDACLLVGGLLIIHYARRARRLGDARMQFVAAVSHELRTPLTVIVAAGQNLRRGIVRDPEHLNKYADLIVEHSKQLADMVEQVLAFAGARRNESALARRPVSVPAVVRQALAACELEIRAAHCETQVDMPEDLPPVLGDALALQRVLQNLLVNAAKHGGGGQWIGVRTRHVNGSSPGRVEIAVSDHGEGIPAREQAQVFEPFFRGARARNRQTRGSGIGLSVVQEIVQVHGGSVRVESAAGEGTTFVVSLPVAEGEASS